MTGSHPAPHLIMMVSSLCDYCAAPGTSLLNNNDSFREQLSDPHMPVYTGTSR